MSRLRAVHLQFILPPTPVLPKGRHTAIRDEAPPIDGQSVEAMATLAMKAEKLELEDRSRGGRIGERDVCVRINTMLETENEYLCQDYLGAIGPDEGGSIDEVCRNKMCEWIFHVVDSTKLRRDTAGQAMNILDRFLGTGSRRAWEVMRSRREFQLCAITTLYIAAKIGEPYLMDATTMSKLSRGMHTVKEITKMELDILTSLRWRVNCPSPYEIANHVLELLPASAGPAAERIYSHSQFQTELATAPSCPCTGRPSRSPPSSTRWAAWTPRTFPSATGPSSSSPSRASSTSTSSRRCWQRCGSGCWRASSGRRATS